MHSFSTVIKTSNCRDEGHIPICHKVFQTHSCAELWYHKREFKYKSDIAWK